MGTLQDGPPHLERPLLPPSARGPLKQGPLNFVTNASPPPSRMDVRREISIVDDKARASAAMPTRPSR